MVELKEELVSKRSAISQGLPRNVGAPGVFSENAARRILRASGRLLLSSITLLLCIACSWTIVEVIFAMAHVGEDTAIKPDPLLGFSEMGNKDVTARVEGFSRSRLNSLGFRENLYAVPKPPGTTRIAILGDSMTLGMEVPFEKTFSKLLEKQLRERGQDVEVLNCGISGTGTGQQYLEYLQKVAPLSPDYLVVSYHLGDTDDNVGGGTNPPRPTFLLDSNKQLRIDYKDVDKWLNSEHSRYYTACDWLRRNSRVLAILDKIALDLTADPGSKKAAAMVEKAFAPIWSKILLAMPKPDWHISSSRQIASEMLLDTPASMQIRNSNRSQNSNSSLSQSSNLNSLQNTNSASSRNPNPATLRNLNLPHIQNTAVTQNPIPNSRQNLNSNISQASPDSTQQANQSTQSRSGDTQLKSESKAQTAAIASQGNGQTDINLLHGLLNLHHTRVAVTLEIVRRLNTACKKNHCQLVIAAMPANDNSVFFYRELNELRKLANEEHFQFIDSWKSFPQRPPMSDSPYHYISHFNCAGHALMCKTLIDNFQLAITPNK